VTRFLRHVLYVRESGGPGWFVIADDLEARQPATFQWLLHALSQMTVVASKAEVTIAAEEAGLRVVMLAPRDLTFAQTDQFDPVPERDFRPQWHLTVSTRSPARSAGFLAVLEPFRAPGARRPDASARGRGRDELRYETPEAPGWLGRHGDAGRDASRWRRGLGGRLAGLLPGGSADRRSLLCLAAPPG
jgi:hypothetical protein